MTQKEILTKIASGGIVMPVFRLKTIDGNNGSFDIEYFESKEEARSESEGTEYPYFFEIAPVSWRPEVIQKYAPVS